MKISWKSNDGGHTFFLLPVGGAMTMTTNWTVHVFRVRLLLKWFGVDWTIYIEVTATSCFMAHIGFEVDLIHSQGGVC